MCGKKNLPNFQKLPNTCSPAINDIIQEYDLRATVFLLDFSVQWQNMIVHNSEHLISN